MENHSANISPGLLGKPTMAAASPEKPSPTHLRPTPIPFPGSSSTSSPTKATACSPAPQLFNASTPKEAKHPPLAATLRTSARKSARHTPPTIFSSPPSDPLSLGRKTRYQLSVTVLSFRKQWAANGFARRAGWTTLDTRKCAHVLAATCIQGDSAYESEFNPCLYCSYGLPFICYCNSRARQLHPSPNYFGNG